jgi:hypothetical protein
MQIEPAPLVVDDARQRAAEESFDSPGTAAARYGPAPKEARMTSQSMHTGVEDQVERLLWREFDTLPRERVRQVARESVEAFRGARVTQFVPLLALREARRRVRLEEKPVISS